MVLPLLRMDHFGQEKSILRFDVFYAVYPCGLLSRLSCVTRRTAISRAAFDFISSFWSFWTVRVSPRCLARYIRFWMRYTACSSFRQGSWFQVSLAGSVGFVSFPVGGAFLFAIVLTQYLPENRVYVSLSWALPQAFAS